MTPTERTANRASTPKAGFLATLCALLRVQGANRPAHRRAPVALCAALVLAALAFTAAPALAAPPEKPELKVEEVFATTATFKGVLSPKGPGELGSEYQFVYRAAKACKGAGEIKTPASPGMSLGAEHEELPSEPVTALKAKAEYTVCLSVTNVAQTESSVSALFTFKTSAAQPPEAPEATEVTERKATTATLNGVVNPKSAGEPGKYQFIYRQSAGECTGAGEVQTAKEPAPGNSPQPVSAAITGLEAGKQYSFCVRAFNALGEATFSTPNTFKTAIPPEPPEASSLKAEPLGSTTATLHGVLNANQEGEAGSFQFVYRQSSSECTGLGEATTGAPALAGKAVPVQAEIKELLPHTSYTFCLRALNGATPEAEASAFSGPVTFTTLAAAPTIEDQFTTEIASTSATLNARVNPQGAATTYTFEYAPAGGAFTPVIEPAGKGSIAEGTTGVPVSVHVQRGLLPATSYEFRLVAHNSVETVAGEPISFTTQPGGGGFALPDGRAWEIVSPPSKYGARLEALTNEGGVIQASEDGAAITYVANAPIVANPPGNSSLQETQVISARGPGAWSSRDIATPNNSADGVFVGNLAEYQWFSPNLSLGLVEPKGNTPLSPEASEKTIYLREPLREEANETYLPLVTAGNVAPGTKFGYHLRFMSATPDLSHVVIGSEVALTPKAPENGLYEWADGQLHPVSVLPNGEPTQAALGHQDRDVRHAISSDGSRIVWFSHEKEGQLKGHLYMRDMTKGETVQLDAVEPGAEGGAGEPTFQTASEDGSKVFFTDRQKLTGDSTASAFAPDLYEFQVTSGHGPLAGKLTDVTVDKNAGESAAVQGVLPGVSEDGSYVYFVANGVLSNTENTEKEKAAPGHCEGESSSPGATCNLYVSHHEGGEWRTTFIAGLSSEDAPDWEVAFKGELNKLTARVSPGGRYFAFMSDRSLTGYNNIDANSPPTAPHPDEEVFLYDASSKHLVCASCNPTGARPVGLLDTGESGEGIGLLVDRPEVWGVGHRGIDHWLAGSIPGWTAAGLTGAFYQSRYLSDSGRLFFNSVDALVPQDTNRKEDVYEYEPQGVGGCTSSSQTFSPKAAGCVALISSGTSGHESAFLDASVSGNDVFFLTAARLVAQDYDTSFDVYDAHVCSAWAPCFAPPGVSPPTCTTGDSCRPAPSPQPSIFAAPASATFSGAGNLALPISKPAVKPLTRAQKLANALKACKKKPKKKRAACIKQARKRYGPVKKARKSSRHTKKGKR